MLKHAKFMLLISCIIFYTTTPKIHIIKPLTRSATHTWNNEEPLHKIDSPLYKDLLINITDRYSALTFLPYLKALKEHKKNICVKAPEELNTLLSWCPYIDKVISSLSESTNDIKIDIEDLAMSTLTTKQAEQQEPLFTIDETTSALWQEQFIQDVNYKVGVFCQPLSGAMQHKDTITIKDFYSLGCMQNISMYTFDQINKASVPEHINIFSFCTKTKKSLTDVAAILNHLDIIITNQPFIAHMAAALAKPVWFIAQSNNAKLSPSYNGIETFEQTKDRNVIFDIMHQIACTMQKPDAQIVTAEIATGELIDKMTILEIKTERIDDEQKLENVWRELHTLRRTFDTFISETPKLQRLITELKSANEALWQTEDLIRDKEREKSFDQEFIRLARLIYIQNDERCCAKRKINKLLGSRLIEEKSYKPYN